MTTWKPLGGRTASSNVSSDMLPGARGSRQIYIPSLVSNRYVHFSWLGDSFCIRDYLGDREMRQSPGVTAIEIWKKKQGTVYAFKHDVKDIDFWKAKLREITEEAGIGVKTEQT